MKNALRFGSLCGRRFNWFLGRFFYRFFDGIGTLTLLGGIWKSSLSFIIDATAISIPRLLSSAVFWSSQGSSAFDSDSEMMLKLSSLSIPISDPDQELSSLRSKSVWTPNSRLIERNQFRSLAEDVFTCFAQGMWLDLNWRSKRPRVPNVRYRPFGWRYLYGCVLLVSYDGTSVDLFLLRHKNTQICWGDFSHRNSERKWEGIKLDEFLAVTCR